MIYCPQCGTANKPNSKFCKNCAALLAPSTDVRCPICGTMNPAGAATCSNCDTRLTTTSATPSDRTTPADTPENITPFTPPEMTQTEEENEGARSSPASTRPSFTRSSSEWLRRVQKTPPPADSSPNNAAAAAATAATVAAAASVQDTTNLAGVQTPAQVPDRTEQDDIPEWLREIQNEANAQAAAEAAASSQAAPTADTDKTDSNHHSAAAAAAGIVAAERMADHGVTENPAVANLETSAPAKPQLSEIKLTGDDYDYSDIAGEVTPEMQAALQANADKLQSVDDETALARKLLGLDVDEPVVTSETANVAPVAAGVVAAEALSGDAPVVDVTPAAAQEDEGHSAAKIIAGVAAAGAAASKIFKDEQETQKAEISTPPPAKPQLSEIKLTGDDYDYSDIGGTVTPEMQAALAANADKLQSVDDETALARKLLGLDVDEPAAVPSETANLAPLSAGAVAASVLSEDAPVADAAHEDEGHSAAKIIAGVAAAGTVAAKMLDNEPDAPKPEAAEPQTATAIDASVAPAELPTALAGETLSLAETETGAALPAAAVAVEQTSTQIGSDEDQTPDWVTALAAASGAAVVAAVVSDKGDDETTQVPAQADAESDVPPALAVGAAAATLDAASDVLESKPAPPPLETGEMPEWLREIAPEELAGTKPLTPDEEGALPAWVQELAPAAVGLGTVAYLSQLPELDEEERGDLPDWLREPVAPEPESLAGVAAAAALAEGASEDAPLEIPSWFSDPAVTSPAADPFEVVEMTGPLAGISGILPLALAITEPHTLTTPMPARSDGGRIFQTLLAEPLASTARAETEEKTKSWFSTNHILYLLIFLAALIPLFFGLEQAGLGLNAVESGTALFYDELQAIPANGTTVVAFEYTPGSAVELGPAARAIVNDLAARRVNVIALTSNPNGVTLAENILQRAKETHPDFTYVNVGYIPGNDAGLRALASGWLPAGRQDVNGVPWGSTPLGGAVRNMDELALTVLIVGDDLTLRNWMEQVQPRITSSIVAATSAMLEPQARNYVNASQLQASLRGLTGAAELELLSNQTGQAVKTVDAFSVVSLVLAGIIIVGNIIFILRRKK